MAAGAGEKTSLILTIIKSKYFKEQNADAESDTSTEGINSGICINSVYVKVA